jgi:hypothetical protein
MDYNKEKNKNKTLKNIKDKEKFRKRYNNAEDLSNYCSQRGLRKSER